MSCQQGQEHLHLTHGHGVTQAVPEVTTTKVHRQYNETTACLETIESAYNLAILRVYCLTLLPLQHLEVWGVWHFCYGKS
jgi:hypothetical protein